MLWPIGNVVNRISLILLPFKFGHKNNEWWAKLPLGKTIGCCWVDSLYVAMTIHMRRMSIHGTSYTINVPSFGYTLTIPQNQPNKQLQQMFFSKSTFGPCDKEILHAKIPKPQIQTIWKHWLIDYMCQHLSFFLIRKNITLFYNHHKTNIKGLHCNFIDFKLHPIVPCINKNVETNC